MSFIEIKKKYESFWIPKVNPCKINQTATYRWNYKGSELLKLFTILTNRTSFQILYSAYIVRVLRAPAVCTHYSQTKSSQGLRGLVTILLTFLTIFAFFFDSIILFETYLILFTLETLTQA